MLSVTNKPFMLSVIMLNVVAPNFSQQGQSTPKQVRFVVRYFFTLSINTIFFFAGKKAMQTGGWMQDYSSEGYSVTLKLGHEIDIFKELTK